VSRPIRDTGPVTGDSDGCQHVAMRPPAWISTAVLAVLTAVGVLAAIGAVVIDVVLGVTGRGWPIGDGWSGAVPGVAMLVPGALVFRKRPWHPLATVMLAFGAFWAVDGFAASWVNLSITGPERLPFTRFAFWEYARLGSVLMLPVTLILVLFPDGRLPRGPVLRGLGVASIALGAVLPLYWLLQPRGTQASDSVEGAQLRLMHALDDPYLVLPASPEVWAATGAFVGPALAASLLAGVVVLLGRFRRADPVLRSQLRWVVWAALVLVVPLTLVQGVPVPLVKEIVGTAVIALLFVAITVAITRYRLYAIDGLISWSLVYGVLVAAVVLLDAIVVWTVGAVIGEQTSAVVAVVAASLVFAPLRERLHRFVRRLVHGQRDDPWGVVSGLAARLEASVGAREQLAEIAEAVAAAFASPFVRVRVERGGTVLEAAHGAETETLVRLPLEYRGERIGELAMAPGRRPRITRRDQALLGDLVRQAAAAVLGTETAAELQRIREGMVRTREEERHRLRRDLHDGLGPLLASIRLRIETGLNLLDVDRASAVEFLEAAVGDASEAVTDVRRLVHDLRPPALDDLGFARALEEQVARFRTDDLAVDLDLGPLPPLPPATEVAAYRIVSEALSNVVRHARARHVVVAVSAQDGGLLVRVADDGVGLPEHPVAGIGLRSQRERAEELGGTWRASSAGRTGTEVLATLPIEPVAPAPALVEVSGDR
jgi:signal transduction histidine kinase